MYYLLYTYPNDKRVHVLHNGDKVVVADENNQQLLIDLGNRLKEEKIIGEFKLTKAIQ